MTREEAIKEDYWDDDGYGHETKQYDDTMLALDMAIETLEQQPCEDCISRQAVLDKWENTTLRGRNEFDQVIMMLPSVTAQKSEDRK